MRLYWKTAMQAVLFGSIAGLALVYMTYVLALFYRIASI